MFHSGTSAWHSPKLHLCCRWNFHQSMQSFGLSATWYITQTVTCTSFSDARVRTTNEVRGRKISNSHYHAAENSNVGCDAVSGEWLLAFQRIAVPSFWKVKQSKENSQSSWPAWCLTVRHYYPAKYQELSSSQFSFMFQAWILRWKNDCKWSIKKIWKAMTMEYFRNSW